MAVAKWGRVMMISPRAARRGYGWLDTLAHEMTHLVLSQATRDRAPLWLQEGVAKRQETRWRRGTPFDQIPSPHDMAAVGIKKGLGLPLTKLGPSIAMLPSAEQAMVVFAQVASFIDWWVQQAGVDALPKLLKELRDGLPTATPSQAIKKTSGVDLATWEKRWRSWLDSKPRQLPPELKPHGRFKHARELTRRRRLGALLNERGRFVAAQRQLQRAHSLLPTDATVRCDLVDAFTGDGNMHAARELVARPKDIRIPSGRWWS